MPADKLTAKQQRFIEEYLIDLNASAAAERAGYGGSNLGKIGSQLLAKTRIREAINAARLEQSNRTKITADYILSRLQDVAERCMQAEAITDREGNPTGEYRFDSSGANKALELLGKHLKLFTDKVEATGKDGGPMTIRWIDNDA